MPHALTDRFVHLDALGGAHVLPVFTGDASWYAEYGRLHPDDGAAGRLVSIHEFAESWSSWEMHPLGSEVVACLSGVIDLIRERTDGGIERERLGPGDYGINPPGSWHTADVVEPARVLFITAGEGTQHRPR